MQGDARADTGALAFGLEKVDGDEDAEFEKRARGHLDVWCAPIDSDILDSSNPCGDASLALEAGKEGWGGVYTITLGGGEGDLDQTIANSSIAADAPPRDSAPSVEDHMDQQPLSPKDEASRRTQEWATLFEEGWIMAAGKGCVPADNHVSLGNSSKAAAGTGRDEQECSERGANKLGTCMQKGASSTNTNRIPAATACENETSATREGEALLQALCAASDVGMQGQTGVWAAPQDDTDEERILEEQQTEWERSIFAFSHTVNLPDVAISCAERSTSPITTAATVNAANDTLAATTNASSTPADTATATANSKPAATNNTIATIPAPCFSPAPSTQTATFSAMPSRGDAGGRVKSLIDKMKNSPGGFLRKTSQTQVSLVASTRQDVLAEHSPAARISELVKRAEETFEKEYGQGSWGGPTRPMSKHRREKGGGGGGGAGVVCRDSDGESSDENEDLLV